MCRKSNKADFDQQLEASSDKLSVISVVVTVVIMLLVICSFLLLLYYFYYPMGKPGVCVYAFSNSVGASPFTKSKGLVCFVLQGIFCIVSSRTSPYYVARCFLSRQEPGI